MRSFDLSTRAAGDVTVVSVAGTVDAVTAPRLAEALQAEVGAGRHRLVADLAATTYVSSAGLRAFLATVKQARATGGDVRLGAVQPSVHQVFDLAGFTTIVRFFDDVDAAVASFA
jgi:anti-sigma B factor antagonist